MMLRYSFNMHREADIIEEAVAKVLDSKKDGGLEIRTGDLGEFPEPCPKRVVLTELTGGKATTKDMSEALQSEVKRLLSV